VSYAPGVDPCLVGSWLQVTNTRTLTIYGNKVPFTLVSGRKVNTFNADGTVSVVFENMIGTANVNGEKWEEITNGWANGRYQAADGRAIYTSWSVGGTWELRRNGRRNNGGALTMSIEPDSYVCTGDTLSFGTSFYAETMTRIRS
jgi:hypothetical protein